MEGRYFGYHRSIPSGIPSDFPNNKSFFVLHDVFHSRFGSWERYVSFGGIRYVLILHYNSSARICLENDLLEQIYLCFEEKESEHDFRDKINTALSKGMTPFWTHLKEDHARRKSCGDLMEPVGPIDFDRDDYHSLQLRTMDTGVTCVFGDTRDTSAFRPLENTFPNLRTFPQNSVHVVETITRNVFKVTIDGNEYCLKAGRQDIGDSIRKFSTMLRIPNVLGVIGLVVNSEDKVIGYLSSFVHGNTLAAATEASNSQKQKWKHQISSALKSLHEKNIIWGDAKPDNIIVNRKDDSLFLIDFDGGCTEGWVDLQLRDSKEGDVQAEERIHEFIDSL